MKRILTVGAVCVASPLGPAGDLRPESDRYVARRGGKRVRWRF